MAVLYLPKFLGNSWPELEVNEAARVQY